MSTPKIEYFFLNHPLDKEFVDFIVKKDGKEYSQKFLKRVEWYFNSGNYKLLVAKLDGQIVGHAGAYRCNAIINGKKHEWWWGVDTFVSPLSRGLGIGRGLQQKLHEFPNFSSQAYSKINGIIKQKCGGKILFNTPFVYYPTRKYFSALMNMFSLKLFHRKLKLPSIPFNKYFLLNKLKSGFSNLEYHAFENRHPIETYYEFFNNNLTHYDFYIERTPDYLRWKYNDNPSMDYICIEIRNRGQDKLLGIVTFTRPTEAVVYLSKNYVTSILDFVSADKSLLTLKEAILIISDYCIGQGVKLDGICALEKTNFFPQFSYPTSGRGLISTFQAQEATLKKIYISYSDQDMEQI